VVFCLFLSFWWVDTKWV